MKRVEKKGLVIASAKLMKATKILKKDFKKFLRLKDLNNLSEVPLAIYLVGNLELLQVPTITVIGSRRISSYGEQVITDLVVPIAQNDICVVSGVAFGCDYYAQKTAIDSGGSTIGVMGCGINYIKTHQHYNFIKNCIDNNTGLFLSEFDPDMEAGRWTFVKRDRIMASLGEKLLVIEASLKSGTMHTVNFALELGKEVYAVPGNIYNSNSLGTNMLIQNGASVALSAKDILDNFHFSQTNVAGKTLTQTQETILKVVDDEKSTLQIAKLGNLPIGEVLSNLTLLELKDMVKKVGDKWVRSSI